MTTELFEPRLGHWPLDAPPADYVLGHVRAVLPDRVLDDALVAVRGGLLAAVEPHPPGVRADVDGAGLLCVPGLVDSHSDGLEKERLPRPGAELTGACAGVAVRCAECHTHNAAIEARHHKNVACYAFKSEKCAGCHRTP